LKVIQRGSMKVTPGKMEEMMGLMKEWTAMVTSMGMDPKKMRSYRRLTGSGDIMNTLVFEYEWNSFAEMATFFEKAYATPEFQKNMQKWSTVLDTHEVEFYTQMQEQG
jgi:hypothetical protein